MTGSNEMIDILVENAETYRDRRNILALTEAETNSITNVMVSKLYQSAIDKSHIDFDDIPKSKGNITAYKGYKTMTETLKVIEDISLKSNIKIPQIAIINKAISNIIAYRDVFEKGFRLDKEFIILQYNVLVGCCVNATTKVLNSYVDFIKRVDKVELVITNTKYDDGDNCIKNLDSFNRLCASGEFSKVMNFIIKNKTDVTESYVSEAIGMAVAIPAMLIAGFVVLVKIIRYGIFLFYNMRMNVSNYLQMQAMFLEINKDCINAEASNISPAKKRDILKRQEKAIKKLRIFADKIAVDNKVATNKTNSELTKEDSGYKYEDLKDEVSQNNMSGYQLL